MLAILILGILGKSDVIAGAAGILLVMQVTRFQVLFPLLEQRALQVGLLFLVISVLVPFAAGRVAPGDIGRSLVSLMGLIAVFSGALATHLNGRGLELLQREPCLMIGLVAGSIVGVIWFRGIPVGPLMAGGIAAFLVWLVEQVW